MDNRLGLGGADEAFEVMSSLMDGKSSSEDRSKSFLILWFTVDLSFVVFFTVSLPPAVAPVRIVSKRTLRPRLEVVDALAAAVALPLLSFISVRSDVELEIVSKGYLK